MAYKLTGKTDLKKWKSRACHCVSMVDIGHYNSCYHLCKYCYANYSEEKIQENVKKHDVSSSLLIGKIEEEIIKNKKGFIAALDQSGGSSGKTLKLYGIGEEEYQTDEEMFELIHTMRKRVLCNDAFLSDKIIGVILFEQTMNKEVKGVKTANYLWDEKGIVSFLKIDKGLEEEKDGVCLMKEIPSLEETLEMAKVQGIFGTKMRSVIQSPNKEGIRKLIEQQFFYAKEIAKKGLVPIIEPEVSIGSTDKLECEKIMKEEIDKQLSMLDENSKVMFKFTIPEVDNFYLEYTKNEKVLRVVALSGG